jgi:hypothetical protein
MNDMVTWNVVVVAVVTLILWVGFQVEDESR